MHLSAIETGVKFKIDPIEIEILWALIEIERDLRPAKV